MKYIKMIILAAFLNTTFIGCSYVSDYVEGSITKRASFSVTAEYIATDEVQLSWDETDSDEDFAGVEIYRTSEANDEYASYELVANRFSNASLSNGSNTSFTYTLTNSHASGIYFYRIGLIHWDKTPEKRTSGNGYSPAYPDSGWDGSSNYNSHTDIDAISGYGKVVIP